MSLRVKPSTALRRRSTWTRQALLLVSCLLSLTALNGNAQASCEARRSLNGLYQSNDRGTYHVRQIGNDVWWVGMSPDNGNTWMNVFHGQINGRRVAGGWVDVPRGKNGAPRNAGRLTLELDSYDRFRKVDSPTGPWASKWFSTCDDMVSSPAN
jgi:hypothetical protein